MGWPARGVAGGARLALLALLLAGPLAGHGAAKGSWLEAVLDPDRILRNLKRLLRLPDVLERPERLNHTIGTRAMLAEHGYPMQQFEARAADGYLLTVFRIPRPGAPALVLQHGVGCASDVWLLTGPGKALGLLLYDAGFDVWLPNLRGNFESPKHETISPDADAAHFWDFSWHENGVYDLPAVIDLVLDAAGCQQLHFVAHSMGTTAFLVLGSERPEYMAKVKTAHLLAPTAFLRDVGALLIRIMALTVDITGAFLQLVGRHKFMPRSAFRAWLGDLACSDDAPITQPICKNVVFLLLGFDAQQFNQSLVPTILANYPAGMSVKQIHHYAQLVHTPLGQLAFRQFSYGPVINLVKYGRLVPPDYNLTRVSARTYLYYSYGDTLTPKSGIEALRQQLPNVAEARHVPHCEFNHMDYLYAIDAKRLLYDQVIDDLNRQAGQRADKPAGPE